MAVEMQRQVYEACPSRESIALERYHEEAFGRPSKMIPMNVPILLYRNTTHPENYYQ